MLQILIFNGMVICRWLAWTAVILDSHSAALAPISSLILVGAGSFIAKHVRVAAESAGLHVVDVRHDCLRSCKFTRNDVVINFGLDPAYSRTSYDLEIDCDLRVAQMAAAAGARFCLPSTRRVYGPLERWNAVETAFAGGDETNYGQNKARTELGVRLAVPNALILRMSNVFGFEYGETPRTSFVGRLLNSLKTSDRIVFDMAPSTRRDFFPVDDCAAEIVRAIRSGASGTFNLGSGFPLACGDIATWVLSGYGSGQLVINSDSVSDEFYLRMHKWKQHFPAPTSRDLRQYCIELGRRLREA